MSRVLVEKETIYTEEVRMLMNGASYKEVIAEMEKKEGQHEANPFARVTPEEKAHVVSETENKQTETAEEPLVEENEQPVDENNGGENE